MGDLKQTTKDALYDRERRIRANLERAQNEQTRAELERELEELQLIRSDLATMDEAQLQQVRERLQGAD